MDFSFSVNNYKPVNYILKYKNWFYQLLIVIASVAVMSLKAVFKVYEYLMRIPLDVLGFQY